MSAFAKTVRSAVGKRWLYKQTSAGSGPIVTFERPRSKALPHLRESLGFQKAMHGGTWMRVNFWPALEFAGIGGQTADLSLGVPPPKLKELHFDSDAVLAAWLSANIARIDTLADRMRSRIAPHYQALDRVCGKLIVTYKKWLTSCPLPRSAFLEDEVGNKIRIVAQDRFEKQVIASLPPKSRKLIDLWSFWQNNRPLAAWEIDRKDYYYCAKCGKWSSRCSPAQRKDKIFGPYFVPICKKC